MKPIKLTKWGVVDFKLVEAGIPHLEAMVYQFIKKFERTHGPIHASIPYVAKHLRMSPRSVQRHIQHLVKVGLLKETKNQRGRFLETTHAKLAPLNSCQTGTPPHAKLAQTHAKLASGPMPNWHPIEVNDRSYISKLKNRESVVPRDLFLDWYNSASKEEIQETINQAMNHANRLQVKLLSGPDGSGKVSALRNYWESQQ